LDEEALNVIQEDATMKVVARGFKWVEGPVWVENGKYLLFSDVMENKIYKLTANGQLSTFLDPSGYTGQGNYSDEPGSNGLIINADAELIIMQHGDRRIVKMASSLQNPQPDFETLVEGYEGKRFNSPNDGFLDKAGNLYFTDPPYGLPLKMDGPNKELDFQGVYCLLRSGELRLLDKLSRPNGITLSPDERTLYVAVSDPEHAVWYQYDIIGEGEVHNKRIFYDVTQFIDQDNPHGLPDGMKTNSKGYLFASGPDGIWIFNSSAKLIARIHTGQATSNCAFDQNESSLFITADDYIIRVNLK
jgi:gluconolactonase